MSHGVCVQGHALDTGHGRSMCPCGEDAGAANTLLSSRLPALPAGSQRARAHRCVPPRSASRDAEPGARRARPWSHSHFTDEEAEARDCGRLFFYNSFVEIESTHRTVHPSNGYGSYSQGLAYSQGRVAVTTVCFRACLSPRRETVCL